MQVSSHSSRPRAILKKPASPQSSFQDWADLHLWISGHDLGLNTTLVTSTGDLEETCITPVLVPGVGNQPVLDTTLYTVTHDLDGVTSQWRAGFVLVHTTLVLDKVGVDGKGSFHWSLGDQLLHDVLFPADRVNFGSVVFVLAEADVVSILTFLATFGSFRLFLAARLEFSYNVVVTGGDQGWLTSLFGVVVSTTDQSLLFPVLPGRAEHTSVTSVSAFPAARHQVFGGEVELFAAVVGDAVSVCHSFYSSERPARSTVSLIPDFLETGALGPGCPGVEGVGQIHGVVVELFDGELSSLPLRLQHVGHTVSDTFDVGVVFVVEVTASLPCCLDTVDVVDFFISQQAKVRLHHLTNGDRHNQGENSNTQHFGVVINPSKSKMNDSRPNRLTYIDIQSPTVGG